MSKYYDSTSYAGSSSSSRNPRKNPWITFLKVVGWCVGSLVVLAAIALWIISYYVSPDRIVKLIEEKSSEYLLADIKIGKLDYNFFRNYPWLHFEVDSVEIISKSLDPLTPSQREALPVNADSLASVAQLKGEINIHSLFHDKINLRKIEIVKPKVNLIVVSDSITNFNIAPSVSKPSKLPQIELSEIDMICPVDFSFLSLPDDLNASLSVQDFFLTKSKDNTYGIGFEGNVSGSYHDFQLPSKMPLRFNTDVKLDLPSLKLKLNNLEFALAGISVLADGEIAVDPQGIDLQKADLNLKLSDIFSLKDYLPVKIAEKIQLPEGLSGFIPLDLSLSILSPFRINQNTMDSINLSCLPSLKAEVKVDDGYLEFSPPKAKKITADDIFFQATAEYLKENPEESFLNIKELRMYGEGISLSGNAFMNNLLGEQQEISGDFYFSSPIMETLSYLMPNIGLKLVGLLKGDLNFNAMALNLGKDGIKDITLSGDILSKSLQVNSNDIGKLRIKNLNSLYKAKIPDFPLSDYSGTKIDFDIKADTIDSSNSGLRVILSSFNFKMDALDTVSGTPDPSGDMLLKLGRLNVSDGKSHLSAEQLNLTAKGSLNSSGGSSNYKTVAATSPGNDAIIASRVSHTPLVLIYDNGGIMQTILNMVALDADLSIMNVNFTSPSYLLPVSLHDVDLKTNLNNLKLTASNLSLGQTSCGLNLDLQGLNPFLTSYSATPVKVSADIDFANVDINQLSWGYYGALIAQGNDSAFLIPPLLPLTAADSTCVAIPRNIDADIRLRSRSAEYMQYEFSPLSTEIIVKDGVATLSQLTVGAPYCTAIVDWTYSTSLLDNIFMDLKARVQNFSFSPFYKVFPQLVTKAPELQNFTGVVNADINCNFLMFPDMFMNSESLKGDFEIRGSDMQFARHGRIEKITHLMLIEGDGPIHIKNMNITGDYHDNILRLNPFKISFDNYQLGIAGVNNVAGDMYYHISLDKSPFHLPFGVSLSGKFKHPEINVGGTHINDYKAEAISPSPDTKIDVNIMAWLKHGWILFVQEAAKYQQSIEK